MYIQQLDIKDIRSFENARIEFSKNINIIIGHNNSGKSTLLKCIQKLQNSPHNIQSFDIRKTRDKGYIALELTVREGYKIFYKYNNGNSSIPEITTNPLRILFEVEDKNEKKFCIVASDQSFINKPEKGAYEIVTYDEFRIPKRKFDGLHDSEDKKNHIYPFFSKRKLQYYGSSSDISATFSVDEDFRNLPAKIKKLANASHPGNEDFIYYCERILGFKVGDLPGENNQTKVGIYITDTDLVYLESMGEGVANILGLLAILLTEDNKVFLIEELENDIHPQSLKYLLELITKKSTNNQFIISTHSNIVLKYLASIENSKVFYTSSEIVKIGRTKIPTSTVEEIDNTPEKRLEILERLGYELYDFDLYSAYIILEESSAEQVIKELLIPVFVPELLNKIKTISAGGVTKLETRFDDFLRLFVYIHTNSIYNRKAWVIADGDAPGKENIQKLKDKFTTWDAEHFITFSKDDFEEYYPEPFLSKYKEIEQKKSKDERRKAKAELTKEVVEYIRNNKEQATKEFKKSAKDVIDVLKSIAEKLKQTA